jgi:acetylornithine deacetylase
MLDPIGLARQLIDVPSVTGEEVAHARLVGSLLEGLGLRVEFAEAEPGRPNVFASIGTPRVVLCSHLDTVPPFFPSEETEGLLYGRGACDTKGIIAAMLVAGERLLADGVRDFGYLFVVGEETDSIGAKTANEQFANRGSEVVIVGEPTESAFVKASKGALTCTIGFAGVAAHSAHPERGESAILKLARAVEAISTASWGEDPEMGKGTANVGVVRGGEKANIVPARAEAECIFRIVDPVAEVLIRVREIVEPLGGSIVRWHGNDPVPMLVPEGERGTVVAFNTDAPHLGRIGKPILFGPGSILDAHSAREKVSKAEVIAAVETYRNVVGKLVKGELRADG